MSDVVPCRRPRGSAAETSLSKTCDCEEQLARSRDGELPSGLREASGNSASDDAAQPHIGPVVPHRHEKMSELRGRIPPEGLAGQGPEALHAPGSPKMKQGPGVIDQCGER